MFGGSFLNLYDRLRLPSPVIVTPAGADLMAAVVSALRNDLRVAAVLTNIYADEAFTSEGLPYAVYTEPNDKPLRVFTGHSIGQGTFDFAVFDRTKKGARQKLTLARAAINAMPVPQNVGDGVLTYIKSVDNSSKSLQILAPSKETDPNTPPVLPDALEFGRVMTFAFKIVRSDP